MMQGSRARRRGAMYILVAIIAAVVGTLGLTGIGLARVSSQWSHQADQAVQARLLARSATDVALFTIRADVLWRGRTPHDSWSTQTVMGEGSFAWKIKDPINGNLTIDEYAPFRVIGRGQVGEVVRAVSVLVKPSPPQPNLLENGTFESGTAYWLPGGGCDLQGVIYQCCGVVLEVGGRATEQAAPRQEVTTRIESDRTYTSQVQMIVNSGTQNLRIVLVVDHATLGEQRFAGTAVAVGSGWTQVSAEITPSWTGSVKGVYWTVESGSGEKGDFAIDRAVLQLKPSNQVFVEVPGSWRREINP